MAVNGPPEKLKIFGPNYNFGDVGALTLPQTSLQEFVRHDRMILVLHQSLIIMLMIRVLRLLARNWFSINSLRAQQENY